MIDINGLKFRNMQFLLMGYDGTDSKAPQRRLGSRTKHLERIAVMKKKGEFLFGGAILDENGQMKGSMVVYEFPDRASLDRCLEDEPYITNGVWQKVEITPFRLAVVD